MKGEKSAWRRRVGSYILGNRPNFFIGLKMSRIKFLCFIWNEGHQKFTDIKTNTPIRKPVCVFKNPPKMADFSDIAILATTYYWDTNPVLCVFAWLNMVCGGGSSTKATKTAVSSRSTSSRSR